MDYDIYARDDYYFGYSSPEFKRLIAALDDTVDPDRPPRPVAADSACVGRRRGQWVSLSIPKLAGLERALAWHGIRQCIERDRPEVRV